MIIVIGVLCLVPGGECCGDNDYDNTSDDENTNTAGIFM